MPDNRVKTREQLLEALEAAWRRIAELEGLESERERNERELRSSEEKYRRLIDNLHAAVIVHGADTAIQFANHRAQELLGVSVDKMTGRTTADPRWSFLHEAGGKMGLEEYPVSQVLRTRKRLSNFVVGVERPDSRATTWVLVNAFPEIDDADEIQRIVVTFLDITVRKRAEQALRESEERFRVALKNTKIAVFEQDRDLRYTWAYNPHRGLSPEALVGKTDLELAPEADAAPLVEVKRRVLERGVGEHAVVRFNDRGEPRFYDLTLEPRRNSEGKVIGIKGASADVTGLRNEMAERRKLEVKIQHAQKLESLGVLAGGIAHDFNNLLTGILGNADLALHGLTPQSPIHPLVSEIHKASRQAADLTNQMLAYSGKGHFVVEELDLNQLVEDMSSLLESSISKKVELKIALARDLPAIRGDASQLRQIVMNLVTNASDACWETGGLIELRTGTAQFDRGFLDAVRIEEELPAGRYVWFEVSDGGCGMDRDTSKRIFDPFFTTKPAGRGLGLAAVQGIVRGHKGAFQVETKLGVGTTFRAIFPALDRPAEPREKQVVPDEWSGSGTVLVVDDEELVRTLAQRALEQLGFAVLTAPDGARAVELFRERHRELACVLLDSKMPHMDGEETFVELRKIRDDVPVILSSGYSEKESTQHFGGEGLAGFIQKPYRLATLREILRRALGG